MTVYLDKKFHLVWCLYFIIFHGESITTDFNNIFHKTKTLIPTLCRSTKSELTWKTEVLIWMTCIQWWNVKLGSHSIIIIMMTSSNGNILHPTGPLCGESMGQQWIPLIKANDTEVWCFCIFFICAWTNGWANNKKICDLRCHSTHHDVTVVIVITMFNSLLRQTTKQMSKFCMTGLLWAESTVDSHSYKPVMLYVFHFRMASWWQFKCNLNSMEILFCSGLKY